MSDNLDYQVERLENVNESLGVSIKKISPKPDIVFRYDEVCGLPDGETGTFANLLQVAFYTDENERTFGWFVFNDGGLGRFYFRDINGVTTFSTTNGNFSYYAIASTPKTDDFPFVATGPDDNFNLSALRPTGERVTIDSTIYVYAEVCSTCACINAPLLAFYSASKKLIIYKWNGTSFEVLIKYSSSITGNLISFKNLGDTFLIVTSSRLFSAPVSGGSISTVLNAFNPTATSLVKIDVGGFYYTNTTVANALLQRFNYSTYTSSAFKAVPGFTAGNVVMGENGFLVLRAASTFFGEVVYYGYEGSVSRSWLTSNQERTIGLLGWAGTVARPIVPISYDGYSYVTSRDNKLYRITLSD